MTRLAFRVQRHLQKNAFFSRPFGSKLNYAPSANVLDLNSYYAGEWVLLGDPETDSDLNVIAGRVLAHSASREEVYRQLMLVEGNSVAIEYAGPLPADLAVVL